MLDFLFASSRAFFKAEVGAELISILFYLCFSHDTFRNDRLGHCQKVFCRGLRAKDAPAIEAAYGALYVYYDPNVALDLAAISNHLLDRKVADSVLYFLLKHRHIPVDEAVISALVSAANSNAKAALVLMSTARRIEYATMLLADSRWMALPLPTMTRTLQLFFVVFGYAKLRSTIQQCPEFPFFLGALCHAPKVAFLQAVAAVLGKLTMSKEFFHLLVKSKALKAFLSAVKAIDDEAAMQAGLEVLAIVGPIDFAREYLILAEKMKNQLRKQTETSVLCVSVISELSGHPQCAQRFVELGLEPYFEDLKKIKMYRAEATTFLTNVEGIAEYLRDAR
jgi:hypothetical protein